MINKYWDGAKLVDCYLENGVKVQVPKPLFDQVVLKMQFPEREYVSYKEGAILYSLSERKFFDLSKDARARIQYGGRILISVKDVNEYLKYCKIDE